MTLVRHPILIDRCHLVSMNSMPPPISGIYQMLTSPSLPSPAHQSKALESGQYYTLYDNQLYDLPDYRRLSNPIDPNALRIANEPGELYSLPPAPLLSDGFNGFNGYPFTTDESILLEPFNLGQFDTKLGTPTLTGITNLYKSEEVSLANPLPSLTSIPMLSPSNSSTSSSPPDTPATTSLNFRQPLHTPPIGGAMTPMAGVLRTPRPVTRRRNTNPMTTARGPSVADAETRRAAQYALQARSPPMTPNVPALAGPSIARLSNENVGLMETLQALDVVDCFLNQQMGQPFANRESFCAIGELKGRVRQRLLSLGQLPH